MGTVIGKQGEFDFDGIIPEKSIPVGKTAPQIVPQKLEPAAKPADDLHFEPHIDGNIADYSGFPANRMYIANEKTILTGERPSWVPPFEYKFIKYHRHIPPVRKVNEQYYMTSGKDSPVYYKLSLDGFTATIDYYVKYGKALNKQEAEEKNIRLIERAKGKINNKENPLNPRSLDYRYFKSILDGTTKILRPKPIRLLSMRTMTNDQAAFFKENGIGKKEMWNAWREIRTDLEQKLIDMSCQYDDLESSYSKGVETSYGNKNTNNTLLEEFGILVKRQNGDAINREEIGEIRNAFGRIKPVFGNLKTICADYGLKVSHSGSKNMHAHRFIGVFYDAYRAIGVKFGDTANSHLILAHELSHFLDSRAGKEAEYFFSSDKPGSIEHQIADVFRKEMNQRTNTIKNSKYFQRTCECFARAMEQFTAFAVSPVQYLSFCKHQAYIPDIPFREKIFPLIEDLITERQGLWHKGEPNRENTPEIFNTLKLQADRDTANYHSVMNIEEMADEFLEKMAALARNRCEWYRQTIDRYKKMETLPRNTLEILKESRGAEHLEKSFEREYRERLKKPDSTLFPIYPADITADRFKEHVITLMKSDLYNKTPLHTARLLIEKASPYQRTAINELLKHEGCINEETTLTILKSWTDSKKNRKPKRDRDTPETDIAS
jgi:hypothetical protein